uniref:BTB domain containing 8 n=1 Tax=Rousettus aegyptiacus TaxID=9407 RepID=A0A7J8K5E3_ROUAE|nr:BTB domain containing 8 [Rousettus aegyptiacus]
MINRKSKQLHLTKVMIEDLVKSLYLVALSKGDKFLTLVF